MKTKLSIIIIFCAIAANCFLQSCTIEAPHEKIVDNHQPKIITDLERINNELLSTTSQGARGWNKWNKEEKTKVVISDMTGAYGGAIKGLSFGVKVGAGIGAPHLVGGGFCALGALIGGAYASWIAAPTRATNDDFKKIQDICKVIVKDDMTLNEKSVILRNNNANNKINITPTLLEETKLDTTSLNIAKMHNIILLSLDGSAILKDSCENEKIEDKYINEMLNSQEFMDSCRVVGIRAQHFELSSDDDLTAKIIILFNKVLEDYASKIDDVAFIIGKYMELIDSSIELTDEQKDSVRYGLATALYSSNYWK